MNTRQSIRKYGRYHRPIARPVLFWLNGHGGKSHGDYERTCQTHTDERARETRTDSPGPTVARLPSMNGVQKEPSMNAVQVEQKSYEMPPLEGFTVAHFLTVAEAAA